MKITTKVVLYISLALLLLIIVSQYEHAQQTSSPGKEGMIIVSNEGSLFIVLDPNFVDTDVDLSIEELLSKYKEVGRLSVYRSDYRGELKTGERVKVWINRTLESYPPIFKAIKIERL